MKLENRQLHKNKYYEFGKELFGPFLYYYSEWILREIMKAHIDKVFFLARDGFMMKKGFERVCNNKGIQIDNEYVYFSRKSIRTALLWKCGNYVESLKYMSVARYVSIGNILDYYGFHPDKFENIAKKYKLDILQDVSFSKLSFNDQIKAMYIAEQEYIIENSKKQYELIIDYFEQISFMGNIAIVDIGWHGSMQLYLEKLAGCCGIDVNICGFYIGINALFDISGQTKGYIFSNDNMKYRKSTLCFFGVWERLFQSREGSTVWYKRVDAGIFPVQNAYEYQNDKDIYWVIENMQQGALEVFDDTGKLCSAEKAIKNLLRFGKYPSAKEVQLFARFYNADGTKTYYLPQKSIFHYKIKEFVHDFSNSIWKTGFMKQAFKIPFPYYWIYVLLRR